jgi:hypothetical protein
MSGGQGLIDSALREIAPEGIDEAALLPAGPGAQHLSPFSIAGAFGGSRLGPKAAGFANDLPGLGIGTNRIAPANPTKLDSACQHEAALGIEDRDKLWRQPQIRVTIRSDVAGSDGRHDPRHGSREGAKGTQLDLAFDLHLVQRRVIPMRQAKAAGAKRRALRDAQMGERVADKNVTRRAKRGLGQREIHRDHSATGGRRLSPTLKPVTKPTARLSLVSGTRL